MSSHKLLCRGYFTHRNDIMKVKYVVNSVSCFLFIHFKLSILNDYLDLNFKMASPTLHANTNVNINTLIVWGLKMGLQTLLLAVVALVLFRLAVDEGEMLQLYSLSFSSPYVKEGVTGKSPLLSRTPSQVRSAVVLHLVHPSISAPLAWFTFATFYFDCLFFSLQHCCF